ncbi:MAG: TRAM domain-containing protein [archaeon]|nr:TRAM domain-containing protein [archaeon]MCP8306969.1 TRAM domain-containing protein [archaeon]
MSEEEKSYRQRSYPLRRFPKTYSKAKPVKVGDELDVKISEISRRGDGLTRVEGFVIFVPNTKQGDNVKIKITQIKPGHAVGQVI